MTHKKPTIYKLTMHAKKSLMHSEKIALKDNALSVEPKYLLYGIFMERGSVGATVLANIGLNKEILESYIPAKKTANKKTAQLKLSDDTKKIITDAHALAAEFGYNYVGTEHLVYALLNSSDTDIQKILSHTKQPKNSPLTGAPNPLAQNHGLFGIENLANLFGSGEQISDSAIDQFCTHITDLRPEPFIGRNRDIEYITTILGRKNKNNPLLIGEPGIGKTAIIEHIAHVARRPDAPHYQYGKEIVTLDLTLLVAGTSFRGEFEQRLKSIISEAQQNKNIILFIDEIHTIIGTGNTGGSLDAANILKPALARGDVRIIGATTLGEYKKHIEKDPALERRFQKIILDEPSADDTRKILEGVKKTFEKYHHVKINKDVLDATVTFANRYLPEQFFPDKAIDVLDETAARLCNTTIKNTAREYLIALQNDLKELTAQKNTLVHSERYEEASRLKNSEDALLYEITKQKELMRKELTQNNIALTVDDIAQTISMRTNIPTEKILQTSTQTLSKISQKLSKHVIGQKEALDTLADTLIRSASGVCNENRPNGSFLFLGATGVGKTLTAKILAQELYNNPNSLVRVDMSELMEKHHTSKLLGAPAGYVGYGEGGTLTEKVRRNPHSVVLFDEIEKAHPDVFNILLQILEDGILTDAGGREINFKNTIIVLTSNIGSKEVFDTKNLGFESKTRNSGQYKNKIMTHAKEILSPELLSRLDHIIVFNQLTKTDLQKITRTELNKLKMRLAQKNIKLTFTPKLTTHIATQIQDKNENARGIRQFLQKNIEGRVAQFIIKYPEKNSVKIDYVKDKIVVK